MGMKTDLQKLTKSAVSKRLTRAQGRIRMGTEAASALTMRDRKLGALIARIGQHRPIITSDPFTTLAGSIVSQQISMSAAAAVQRRVRELCPRKKLSPEAILRLTPAKLRAAGLSRQKVVYMHDLADHFVRGELSSRSLRRMSDEEVIEATTRVKGIGRWTAEMLLIFCLERPDIWPIDDLGIRKAVRNHLGLADFPPKEVMHATGEPWRPYRSYASWYLWRSLEGPLMPGVRL